MTRRTAQGRWSCPARRLTPLSGGGPVDMWTTLAPRPHAHRRTKTEEADNSRATKTGQLHSLSTEIFAPIFFTRLKTLTGATGGNLTADRSSGARELRPGDQGFCRPK